MEEEAGIGCCRLGCAEGPHGRLPVPTALDRGAPKRSDKGPERRERGGGDRRRARRLATCRGPGAGGQPLVASPHCCAEQGSALSHHPGSHASAVPPSCWNQRRRRRPACRQRSNSLTNWGVKKQGARGARGGRDLGEQPGPRAGSPPEAPLMPCLPAPLPRGAPHSPPPITLRKHSIHCSREGPERVQRGSSRPSSRKSTRCGTHRAARRAGGGAGGGAGTGAGGPCTRGARRPATPRPTGGWRRRRDRPAAPPPPRGGAAGRGLAAPSPRAGRGGRGRPGADRGGSGTLGGRPGAAPAPPPPPRRRRGAGAPAPLPFPARAGAQGRSGRQSGALGGLWHAMAASHPHHPPPASTPQRRPPDRPVQARAGGPGARQSVRRRLGRAQNGNGRRPPGRKPRGCSSAEPKDKRTLRLTPPPPCRGLFAQDSLGRSGRAPNPRPPSSFSQASAGGIESPRATRSELTSTPSTTTTT